MGSDEAVLGAMTQLCVQKHALLERLCHIHTTTILNSFLFWWSQLLQTKPLSRETHLNEKKHVLTLALWCSALMSNLIALICFKNACNYFLLPPDYLSLGLSDDEIPPRTTKENFALQFVFFSWIKSFWSSYKTRKTLNVLVPKELNDRELRYKYEDFSYKWDHHSIGI